MEYNFPQTEIITASNRKYFTDSKRKTGLGHLYQMIRIYGKTMLATAPATTPASKVVIAVLGASKRSMDSMTSNEEASGAANAAARPAPAPAASNCFRSPRRIRVQRATRHPTYEPICTEGPSRPSDNPAETERIPPKT